ncbi:tetratricopeptide repeat protein [Magnetococcus sp. PR-3]|uniref:tetratricopeptide repeat protein n=1 Tax=Magnetococcus sp. PR-3 TaxID=3120355 RepID=UPI002FCE3CDD
MRFSFLKKRPLPLVLVLLSLWLPPLPLEGQELSAKDLYRKGYHYFYGRGGVEKDRIKAFQYYQHAGNLGHTTAQYATGWMLMTGRGVAKNHTEALGWLEKAASVGDKKAQYFMGVLLLQGEGVTPNPQQAIHWITQAAQQDYPAAQRRLGKMYQEGTHLPMDEQTGRAWLKKAAKQGDMAAKKLLHKVRVATYQPKPSPAQKTEAVKAKVQQPTQPVQVEKQPQVAPVQHADKAAPAQVTQQKAPPAKTAKPSLNFAEQRYSGLPVKPAVTAAVKAPTPLSEEVVQKPVEMPTSKAAAINPAEQVKASPKAVTRAPIEQKRQSPLTAFKAPQALPLQPPLLENISPSWLQRRQMLRYKYRQWIPEETEYPASFHYFLAAKQFLARANQQAALLNDAVALTLLYTEQGGHQPADWLFTLPPRLFNAEKTEQVLNELQMRAEEGSPAANYFLGMRKLHHEGDLTQGVTRIKQSAESGFPLAQHRMFLLHLQGPDQFRDMEKATKWGEQASARNLLVTQARLGLEQLTGNWLPKDIPAGLQQLMRVAQHEDQRAIQALKQALTQKNFDHPDAPALLRNTLQWLRSYPQHQGRQSDLVMQLFLQGQPPMTLTQRMTQAMQSSGEDRTTPNIRVSDAFFEGVSDVLDLLWRRHYGDQQAQHPLLTKLASLKNTILPPEQHQTLQEAAHNNIALAQQRLAYLYLTGLGVNQDLLKARYWLFRHARSGQEREHARSQGLLALLLDAHHGLRTPLATAWMTRAQKWNFLALLDAVVMHQPEGSSFSPQEEGEVSDQTFLMGIKTLYNLKKGQEPKQAIQLIHQAAQHGYGPAQYTMGLLYLDGLGVKRSPAKATIWHQKALAQGYIKTPLNLAAYFRQLQTH